MSLKFDLLHVDASAETPNNGPRRGVVHTAHGDFQTPAFMAVGTAATVKAMTMDDVRRTGTEVILGNTYHLMMRPGGDLIAEFGGLHKFGGWHGPILTDSGGFQAMSLSGGMKKQGGVSLSGMSHPDCGGIQPQNQGLVKMTEEGIHFTSHIDGGVKHFMRPEDSMHIQNQLDSDITMALDQCLHLPTTHELSDKNVDMVTRWARRSYDAFVQRDGYGIFGIVQGATFPDLRRRSADALTQIGFDGFAVGGLAVGEPQDIMFDMISTTTPMLPANRPRYLMGVGTPLDIIGAVARGIDMFDCVMPTRAGRTGQAFTSHGTINLRNAKWTNEHRTLSDLCGGGARFNNELSLGYIHHLIMANEILGVMILSAHNLTFYQSLMSEIRNAIEQDDFQNFAKKFIATYENKE